MRMRPPPLPPKGPMGTGKPIGPKGVAPPRPGMPVGPRMPVTQGVGKPTPRPSPETTLPVRPANLTPQANQPDPQLQFQSAMWDRLTNTAGGMRGMGGMKKGGTVKMKSGSASKRADGIAQRGKTKGKIV